MSEPTPGPVRTGLLAQLVLGGVTLIAACGTPGPPPVPSEPPLPAPAMHAVLINGGHNAASNFASHLRNLQDITTLLEARGVPRDHVTVFASDGRNPAADLKIRDEASHPEQWLLEETSVWKSLRPRSRMIHSALPGYDVRPANIDVLWGWFLEEGQALRPGDTLFLYVTDHGEPNKDEPGSSFISMWENRLSVSSFQELLATLPPGVRTVLLMSQCYSGGFAKTIYDSPVGPSGEVCGFFSTTADRKAYGCYADVQDREGLGHSFRFFRALSRHADLDGAHREVLLTDQTPDVPLRTSSLYLAGRIRDSAKVAGESLDRHIETWLAKAMRQPERYEPFIRQLDGIGQRFGMSSPRTLAELEATKAQLETLVKELRTYRDRWKGSLSMSRRHALSLLMEAEPSWKARLEPEALKALGGDQRKTLREGLSTALQRFVENDADLRRRLHSGRKRHDDAKAMHYRTEIRLAAVLRSRSLLVEMAAREMLAAGTDTNAVNTLARLERCEQAPPWGDAEDVSPLAPMALPEPEPLPPLDADRAAVESVLPSFIGLRYARTPKQIQEEHGVQPGAALVTAVFKDTPAMEAGIRVGDVVLGPEGGPMFTAGLPMREWIQLAPRRQQLRLAVIRDNARISAEVTLVPFPLKWPDLPGPPELGTPAPKLSLQTVQSEIPPLNAGKNTLLFFWATWCKPCKAAVPDLMELAERYDAKVISITAEERAVVEKFLDQWSAPFPAIVTLDELRITSSAYGISGTPTFVRIDAQGRIVARQVGYSRSKKLNLEGGG